MPTFTQASGSVLGIRVRPSILVAGHSSQPPGNCGNDLEALILESIDETLSDLLGVRAREAVYGYLERNCFMAKSEIPKSLNEFLSVLDATFGKGSKTIGIVIAKRLYTKLGLKFTQLPNAECKDYIELARAKLEK
jgi:hypothetical protein